MRMAGVVSRTQRQGLLSTGKLFVNFCNRRKALDVSHGDEAFYAHSSINPTRIQTRKKGGWIFLL